jgi:phage terminase small subunit
MDWGDIPAHLRPLDHWPDDTRRRVESLVEEFEIEDTGGLLVLQSFGNAEAREQSARDQIEREGQTVLDRFDQAKPHPLLSVERDARSQKLQALKALNLDLEPLTNK